MPTVLKLFDYTSSTPTELVAHDHNGVIATPYVKDNTLYALFGHCHQCGFVNLVTGAKVIARDAVWDAYGAYGILVEPFHVKGDKIVARWAYYTTDFHIKIRKVTYDLTAQTISSVDEALDIIASDPSWTVVYNFVLGGKTLVTAYWGTPSIIRFVDLVSGAVVDLDLTVWLGTLYRSLVGVKCISKGRELEMQIGRYLAGDVHRYVNINTGVGVDLLSTGGGSPQGTTVSPLRFSDKRLFPLTSNTVIASTNRIDWYNEAWTKVGETTFADITAPNPRSGAVLAKLANGNYLVLMLISSLTVDAAMNPMLLKLYEISSSTFAVVNTWELDNVSTYVCWASMSAWSQAWTVLQLPIVDTAKKLIYVFAVYRQDAAAPSNYRQILYRIDISDLSVDEWNTYLWLIKTASPLKVETPKFFDDFMNTEINLEKIKNLRL